MLCWLLWRWPGSMCLAARLAGSLGCTLACSASTTSGPSTGRRMMTQRLDPRSDRPLSLQLADVLRAEIQEGVRGPGSQLPTESEFQHEYGVSRTTIRAALSTLAAEGLVVTRKGFGSYVRDRPPLRRVSSTHRHASHRASGKPEFDTEAISQGQVPSRRMLMTGRGPVPADIAGWLGCQAGDDAVIRQRLQLLDDVPAVISTSYYPLWVAEGTRLESPGRAAGGSGQPDRAAGSPVCPRRRAAAGADADPGRRSGCWSWSRASRWSGCCTSTTTRTAGRSRSPMTCTPLTGTSSRSSGPGTGRVCNGWVAAQLV